MVILREMRQRMHADELALFRAGDILFRDAGSDTAKAISRSRFIYFWYELVAELEKRLNELGEVDAHGKPDIALTRNSGGNSLGAYSTRTVYE